MSNDVSAIAMLTMDDLASALKVSKRTLARMLSAGKLIPPTRLGRQLRWLATDVAKWVEAGCPEPRSWPAN